MKINIFWYRRDLRLDDNRGFFYALEDELPTLPLFIFDKNILKKLNKDDARVGFIHESLKEIKKELRANGSDLLVKFDSPTNAWKEILKEYEVGKVFVNEDYEPYAFQRDQEITELLLSYGVEVFFYKDQCIFSKNDILKNDGNPYTVYTPYKNKWLENLRPSDLSSFNTKKHFKGLAKIKTDPLISLSDLGFEKSNIKIPSSKIVRSKIENYDKTRDIPIKDGTSLLGIHLRFGTISVRKCAQVAFELNQVWLSELIWREFFMQILFHFPHVNQGPFRDKYKKIKWRNDKGEFKKWCEGKTGYPLVDAGMRELNQTGHMHNRVRMLVASFLVKHLLIDWRWGESYFASKLLDFDLASNNGNWQWVAGTGCDAAPYFRVFNPETQQKKFDPDFKYIKKWVPEFGTDSYPNRMVDHQMAYQRAISVYKKV